METHDEEMGLLEVSDTGESLLSVFLVLVPTSRCDGAEQPVAEEKRGNADEGKVSQRLKHVQVEEVAQIQGKYRWKSNVKS